MTTNTESLYMDVNRCSLVNSVLLYMLITKLSKFYLFWRNGYFIGLLFYFKNGSSLQVQFNLQLSEKEKKDRAKVVLPFEHQGMRTWLYKWFVLVPCIK